jgi:hypothetical protein
MPKYQETKNLVSAFLPSPAWLYSGWHLLCWCLVFPAHGHGQCLYGHFWQAETFSSGPLWAGFGMWRRPSGQGYICGRNGGQSVRPPSGSSPYVCSLCFTFVMYTFVLTLEWISSSESDRIRVLMLINLCLDVSLEQKRYLIQLAQLNLEKATAVDKILK